MTAGPNDTPLLRCRSVDHLAYTVPKIDEAVGFFCKVFGARVLYRASGPDEQGRPSFAERFNTHPAASYTLAKLDLNGTAFELFEYHAPDLWLRPPRNCDAGGGHFAVVVDDVDASVEVLRRVPGVKVLGAPSRIGAGHPLKGRRWVYFLTPWGLQVELVSPPEPPQSAFPGGQ